MPKHEVDHPAGRRLDEALRGFLATYFQEPDIERIERLGGRVTISLAVSARAKRRKGEEIVIDSALIKQLESLRTAPDEFRDVLRHLTVGELQKLSKAVGHPARPGTLAAELRAQLLRHFQAEDVWRGISGSPPSA